MRSLDLFLPWILPYVPGCSDPLAKQMVVDACIDFCGRTNLIQEVDAQDVVADQAEYTVNAPTQQRLTRVFKVFYDATELSPVPLDDVRHGAAARAGIDDLVEPVRGTPAAYHQTTPTDDVIYLWPVPDTSATAALTIRASFEPNRNASQVADDLYDQWALTVAYGALARLMNMTTQPFYNPRQAEIFQKQFDADVASAASVAARGSLRKSSRVQPRAFA